MRLLCISLHLQFTGQPLQIRPPLPTWMQVKLILMPLTLMGIQYGLTAAAQSIGSPDPTADGLAQWLNCGPMRVGVLLPLPLPPPPPPAATAAARAAAAVSGGTE